MLLLSALLSSSSNLLSLSADIRLVNSYGGVIGYRYRTAVKAVTDKGSQTPPDLSGRPFHRIGKAAPKRGNALQAQRKPFSWDERGGGRGRERGRSPLKGQQWRWQLRCGGRFPGQGP